MTHSVFPSRPVRILLKSLAVILIISAFMQARAGGPEDKTPRIAVISAFAPELTILKGSLAGKVSEYSLNGVEFTTGNLEGRPVVVFLSGISVVNAAMTVQLALDHFPIERIVFSGIAGGVDPELHIGDVVIADRWAQYLEMVFAREVDDGWETIPFFEYPYPNFGMMFPRSVTVVRAGDRQPEPRFWFPVDEEELLPAARRAAGDVTLARCTTDGQCLENTPRILIGGAGVSGGVFIDNEAFREYVFETFDARVLDMESSAVAHVAYSNQVPYIAVRSLSDLAGGGGGANQMETFLSLAAENATSVVKALLRAMPE